MGGFDHVEGGRPAPSAEARAAWNRRTYNAHVFRLVLLVAWLAMAGAFAVVGEQKGDLTGLIDAVEQGRVTQVTVEGAGLTGADQGAVEQFVHWREGQGGWHRLYVRVEATDEKGPSAYVRRDGEWRVYSRDVGSYLAGLDPGLTVTRHSDVHYDVSVLAGWRVPNWLGVVVVVVQLFVLLQIVAGPEPRRATRWAWFWLFLLPPGGLLFLVLSGPTPFVPPPRDPRRRLTGGWAFLISLFLGGLDRL